MHIGIVGGGINGLATAWVLAGRGHEVTLFERGQLVGATSSASSKLLHGGIRYLENLEFRLVRESLRERDAWLMRAPDLAEPLPILFPLYRTGMRSRLVLGAGFFLYDQLAGKSVLPRSKWLSASQVIEHVPELNRAGLSGGYRFYDGQMHDRALGLWVADQARECGVEIHEGQEVTTIDTEGHMSFAEGSELRFDRVVNAAGPWAVELLDRSGIPTRRRLDLVRGSHLVLDRPCSQALLLEAPGERRIFFVLPWEESTLVGTTEVRHDISEPVQCTSSERTYLLQAYGHYFPDASCRVIHAFSGIRPLLRGSSTPRRASRDYVVERNNRLVTILGGKWTTSLALARKVSKMVHYQ